MSEWERAIQSATTADPVLQKINSGRPLSDSEIAALAQKRNQPAYYFAEENLRRAYQQPGGGLVDFIRAALGLVKTKPRGDQLEENFRAWLVTKNLSPQQAGYLHLLKNRGLARGQIEVADLVRSNSARICHSPASTRIWGYVPVGDRGSMSANIPVSELFPVAVWDRWLPLGSHS